MTMITRRAALRLAASAAALPVLATAANAASHAAHETHTVTIQNMAFTPANLSIKAGDSVTFVNMDNMRHSATDLNKAWDTGLLANGQSATITFNAAGSFNYRCTPHGNMRGSITIS
ncbi:cupredoxin family copper-binding protein [Yoonia sp. R2331]|uniref:cupredoxin domain-containing protein n=1 Tax=Yoonia sp. R2331 TaxID=3237238 RepID=UPI0034E500AF